MAVAQMPCEIEAVARRKGPAGAGATHQRGVGSPPLPYGACTSCSPWAFFKVLAWVIVNLELAIAPTSLSDVFTPGLSSGSRNCSPSGRISRAQFLLHVPAGDDIFLLSRARQSNRNAPVAAPGRLCARLAIGQDQGVLVLFVLEEIENALLLHQPRDKIEIRLAILHAVFARLKTPLEPILKSLKPGP